MKLYLKRLRNAVPVSISDRPEGPYHVIGDSWLGKICSPIQIYNLTGKVRENEAIQEITEVDVDETTWRSIKHDMGIEHA